ncbi:MAG: fibronectin type III domain-containing protein, partial [Gemmatimonadota bacterium]
MNPEEAMRRIVRYLSPLMVLGIVSLTACEDDEPAGPGNGNDDPPAAASNVTATADGTEIEVTWSPPANDVTDQRVELVTSAEADREQELSATATSATFTDLTEGATYAAQVFTINANGETGSSIATATIGSSTPAFVDVFTDVEQDTTWTADRKWVLNGPIFVGTDCGPDPQNPLPDCNAVTLTIEPGTTILGDVDPPQGARGSYLVVSRGSRIIADANADEADPSVRPAPENVIAFTSNAPRGQRDRGDWGGLVLNGRAPINTGSEATGEGESG